MRYRSHLIELWELVQSDEPLPHITREERTMQGFQHAYTECLNAALVELCKYGSNPTSSILSYQAESSLWAKYFSGFQDNIFPFSTAELEMELGMLYDTCSEGTRETSPTESYTESYPLSRQTTIATNTNSTEALSNSALLLSLCTPSSSNEELANINSAPPQALSSRSLSPVAQSIADTKFPHQTCNPQHAHIMSLYLLPSSTTEPQTPPSTPKPISLENSQSVLVPPTAMAYGSDDYDLRTQIRLALQSNSPKAQPPQQGWAEDGTPMGSVRLLAENFAESYDMLDESDMIPEEAFERRTKGIFVLRVATVQGMIHKSHYIWLEFAPQHTSLKEEWFWKQVWKQSSEFLPFLRDRQYKDADGRWVMHAVDEEWMEWKKTVDRSGFAVRLDLTAKALKFNWKIGCRTLSRGVGL